MIRCSPNCWKCTASLGSISIRMPGSNVHEIGLRWGNEHEGIVGKLSKKNGKSCTNTAIGSTAGGPQTRERNLKSPGAALPPAPPLPGPRPSSFKAATRRPHYQAAQTKAENARELNPEENDKRSSPRWTTRQLLSLRGCPDAAVQRAVCP
jgi:hypothetical protein